MTLQFVGIISWNGECVHSLALVLVTCLSQRSLNQVKSSFLRTPLNNQMKLVTVTMRFNNNAQGGNDDANTHSKRPTSSLFTNDIASPDAAASLGGLLHAPAREAGACCLYIYRWKTLVRRHLQWLRHFRRVTQRWQRKSTGAYNVSG